MTIFQNIKEALTSIRGNITRTVITCLIISFGIMALVGILTAIDGVESSLVKNFSFMGANSFNIQNRSSGFSLGRNKKRVYYENISYKQAQEFKDRFEFDAEVSVNSNNSWNAIAKRGAKKTNPNTNILGGDGQYLTVAGYDLALGRNITEADVERNSNVAVIGQEIKQTLFGEEECLNHFIKIGGVKLRVVGLVAPKGGAFDFGGDRIVLVPVSLARAQFPRSNQSYNIGISVADVIQMETTAGYAENLFRQVRRLKVKEETNFSIIKSDSISAALMENLKYVLLGAIFIAAITLVGAAIALMNIMLVSVTERTKEIGTRKAIGAKSSTVLNQFVIEAITICQIGGLGGIVLGLIMGNITSSYIGGSFIVPWNWMLLALFVCTIVGLGAGIWPAYKASKINPIEALRHEG
ncbi:MAG: FtsX-like permease family protein [Bacteroidetes bacterium]|jgi:putative ABC transport system permease protein|nr:FtsX-like permease family protein [Bacteroidota bacterium]MDA8930198.1 ABC transporter permease [Bacteroidia bacterium]